MHKSREWLDKQQEQENLYFGGNKKSPKIKLKKEDYFNIQFSNNYFKKNDIVYFGNNYGKVVGLPRNKKRHKFLHFITFGLYKTTNNYRIKLIKDEL